MKNFRYAPAINPQQSPSDLTLRTFFPLCPTLIMNSKELIHFSWAYNAFDCKKGTYRYDCDCHMNMSVSQSNFHILHFQDQEIRSS